MKKRILALIMAATLTFGMSFTSFAAETETNVAVTETESNVFTLGTEYKIVNEAPRNIEASTGNYDLVIKNAAPNHTYNLYKIFDMSVYESRKEATVNDWGNGITDAGKTALLNEAKNVNKKAASAYDVAAYLGADERLAASYVSELVKKFAGFKNSASYTATSDANEKKNLTINVAAGYYLVEDIDNAATDNNKKPVYSLQLVLEGKDVEAKNDTTTLIKKVDDKNDSRPTIEELNKLLADTADHEIGDNVHYTLKTTIPSYTTKAPTVFTMYDNMDLSLDFIRESLVVTIDNQVVAYNSEKLVSNEHGFTLDLLEYVTKENAGKEVVVTFDATLNTNAVIGMPGNKNEAHLKYTNENGEEVDTPNDTVIVFTYTVLVNKTDKEGNPLAGATFTLYKLEVGEKNADVLDEAELVKAGVDTASLVGNYYMVAEIEAEANGDKYTSAFVGVDDGCYILVETVTPAGYNTMKPVKFEINATHTQDNDNPAISLTDLTGTGDITFTKDVPHGTLSADVVNYQGSLLPSTGGMGTTLFYIIGGMLVVFAGVVLFAKKKMANEQ